MTKESDFFLVARVFSCGSSSHNLDGTYMNQIGRHSFLVCYLEQDKDKMELQ